MLVLRIGYDAVGDDYDYDDKVGQVRETGGIIM